MEPYRKSRLKGVFQSTVESWRYFRSRRVRHTCARFLEAYVFAAQEWAVFHNDLAGPPPEAVADEIVFRFYGPGDGALLSAFEPWHPATELRAQLNDGCWLDFAFDADRPVAYRVVSAKGPRRAPLGRMITLTPGQVWVVNLFCLPKYRSRGIGRRLAIAMDRRLASLGYSEVVLANRLDNVPTLRLSFNKGNKLVLRFSYFRLLVYARYRVAIEPVRLAEVTSLQR